MKMKTPDEIKKAIAYCAEGECGYCKYHNNWQTCTEELLNDALAYIQQLEAAHRTEYCEDADYDCIELGKARKRIAELEAAKGTNAPSWIDVDERLPLEPCCVLVNLLAYVNIAWYHREGTFETPSGVIFNSEEVSHWMPLPQPPKEDEHD